MGKQNATSSSIDADQKQVMERKSANEASKADQSVSSGPGAAVPVDSLQPGKCLDSHFCAKETPA